MPRNRNPVIGGVSTLNRISVARRTVAGVLSIATLAVLASGGGPSVAQPATHDGGMFLAFRFDDSHVIAVVKVLDDAGDQRIEEGLSGPPIAQYGFPYFAAPYDLRAHVPAALQAESRWQVHVGPGRILAATAERIVGGNAACQQAAAVLLAIAPSRQHEFAAVPHHYFVAEAHPAPRSGGDAVRSGVGVMPARSLADAQKQSLESLLDDVMTRELPSIRGAAEPEIARMAQSTVLDHRSWAAERRRIDEQLLRGDVRLSYDIQAFRLDPTGTPMYFVRAEWLAGQRQALAATLWLRGDRFETVEADSGPSSWLRTFEFQGALSRVHLGLVLNVLDRDRDGWGEIILARGGYESLSIDVLEYSTEGFVPTGISFTSGC